MPSTIFLQFIKTLMNKFIM